MAFNSPKQMTKAVFLFLILLAPTLAKDTTPAVAIASLTDPAKLGR